MQNNNPHKDKLKSIFSYNVYRTNEPARHLLNKPNANNLKSSSLGLWKEPELIYFNDRIISRNKKLAENKECSTQTSKTILQLAKMESGYMSPDSLTTSPRQVNYSTANCPYSISNRLSDMTLDGSCHEQDCIFNSGKMEPLTSTFLKKKRQLQSRSSVDCYPHPNFVPRPLHVKPKPVKLSGRSSKSLNLPDNSMQMPQPFMKPTASSLIKSKMAEVQNATQLIPHLRRGRSLSPRPDSNTNHMEATRKIPYIDQCKSEVSSATTIINCVRNPEKLARQPKGCLSLSDVDSSHRHVDGTMDNAICNAVMKFRDADWSSALRGLAEIVELCRVSEVDLIYDYMIGINQRLIELLKSPRSHVCRTACQAAGHLFEYVKDTRRPEFDDIVEILLCKTADSNKFIRQDANLALDCMVTHISLYNAIRVLCAKGPVHKNHLVRCATIRLMVCAIVIAGPDFVLNPNNNEYTRRRIIINLARFLEDKSLETRKFAERLYKVLCKEPTFEVYLKKYLEKEQILKIKKTLKLIHKK